MKTCNKCKGNRIKSRRNYSHGKKSKSTTVLTCRDCGSADVTVKSDNWKNNRKKRR